jgi:hypothetical protein
MTKPIVRLDAWWLVRPGEQPLTLLGFATGHPRLTGYLRYIRTSLVLSFEPETYRTETLNTIYWLGHSMDRCGRGESGQIIRFEQAGFAATKNQVNNIWTVSNGQTCTETPGNVEITLLVDRILSISTRLPMPSWLPH